MPIRTSFRRTPVALLVMLAIAAATPASAVEMPVEIRVLRADGNATVTGRAGAEVPLANGTMLSADDVITTRAGARAAILFMATADTPEVDSDLLLLGSDSSAQIAAGNGAAGTAPMVVRLKQGAYRAVIRNAGGTPHFTVEAGGRVVHFDGADATGVYSPGTDNAKFMCRKGSLVINQGKRNIRLKSGMARVVDRGKILGARRLADGQWDEAAGQCAIANVDVSQPVRAAKKSPTTVPMEKKSSKEVVLGADGVKSKTDDPLPTTRGTLAPPMSDGAGADFEYVRMKTSMGMIVLELDRKNAPISVENFLGYVDSGFYAGTIFHRVMSNFMIQGGGFSEGFNKKTAGPGIKNEWQNGLKNLRGSIAMARLGRQPDSGTCQFFINVVDNAGLDVPRDGAGYAVFGKVIHGMDVVDAIRAVPTTTQNGRQNVPETEVVIEVAERTTKEEALE